MLPIHFPQMSKARELINLTGTLIDPSAVPEAPQSFLKSCCEYSHLGSRNKVGENTQS